LVRWDIIQHAEYVLVDEMTENIEYASAWIPQFATEAGLSVERSGKNRLKIFNEAHVSQVQLEQADVFHFIHKNIEPAYVLIAHAFLDLLPMPESLPGLLSLTKNLAWMTINFDGVTTFEPMIEKELDRKIEKLYHETMDNRRTGGDSKSGRHMFNYLRDMSIQVISAGPSDWVVYGQDGKYQDNEEYFLNCILSFFEESLTGHGELNEDAFVKWTAKRREQIKHGELVYIAHQMDFLVKI